jgi:hypothetical protein
MNDGTQAARYRGLTFIFLHIKVIHCFHPFIAVCLRLLSGSVPDCNVRRVCSGCNGIETFPINFNKLFRPCMFLD